MISSKTRIQSSRNYATPAATTITEEGLALMAYNDGGVQKAIPTAGHATNDVFLGFSLCHQMNPTTLPWMGTVVAVGTTLTLPLTPISGQVFLKVGSTIITLGDNANAGEYEISGTVVSLNAAQSGATFTVLLRYSPTVAQIAAYWAEGAQVGLQSRVNAQNSVSVITQGTVATTCFTTGDYVPGRPVKTGANGFITTEAGSGTTLPGVTVEAAPDVAGGGILLLDVKRL